MAEGEWSFPREKVINIENAIKKGIPLRSDTHAPQNVRVSIYSDYDTSYCAGSVFLEITLDDEYKLNHLFHDTSPFWPQWIDFLGKIVNLDLPAQFTWDHTETFMLDDAQEYKSHEFVRYEAVLLDVRQNFRLKIYKRWHDDDEDFLILDEVVDRYQFVGGFTDGFSNFLQTDYQMYPDLEGKTLDLRTLPLENLKNFAE